MSSLTEMTGTGERAGHPFGGAVPGPRLAGEHVGVGHQVDVGPGDAAGVGREDDGRVHLAQLGQALRRELGVHQEATRADGQHIGLVADDEERAPLGLDDPVQPVPQRRTRGDERERGSSSRCHGGPASSQSREPWFGGTVAARAV